MSLLGKQRIIGVWRIIKNHQGSAGKPIYYLLLLYSTYIFLQLKLTMAYNSGPQSFGHHGPVPWRDTFLQTGGMWFHTLPVSCVRMDGASLVCVTRFLTCCGPLHSTARGLGTLGQQDAFIAGFTFASLIHFLPLPQFLSLVFLDSFSGEMPIKRVDSLMQQLCLWD